MICLQMKIDIQKLYSSITPEQREYIRKNMEAVQKAAISANDFKRAIEQVSLVVQKPNISEMKKLLLKAAHNKQTIDRRKRHGKCRFDKQGLIRRMCTYWNEPICQILARNVLKTIKYDAQ